MLKSDDIKKYIGQFMTNEQLIFSVTIKSQFYSSKRVLIAIRSNDEKEIRIDKSKWKKKKAKFKNADVNGNNSENNIHQSLSMKIADIHSGQPRFQ